MDDCVLSGIIVSYSTNGIKLPVSVYRRVTSLASKACSKPPWYRDEQPVATATIRELWAIIRERGGAWQRAL